MVVLDLCPALSQRGGAADSTRARGRGLEHAELTALQQEFSCASISRSRRSRTATPCASLLGVEAQGDIEPERLGERVLLRIHADHTVHDDALSSMRSRLQHSSPRACHPARPFPVPAPLFYSRTPLNDRAASAPSAFRPVPRRGSLRHDEAERLGFKMHHPEGATSARGSPTPASCRARARRKQVVIRAARPGLRSGRGLWELRESIAGLYNKCSGAGCPHSTAPRTWQSPEAVASR